MKALFLGNYKYMVRKSIFRRLIYICTTILQSGFLISYIRLKKIRKCTHVGPLVPNVGTPGTREGKSPFRNSFFMQRSYSKLVEVNREPPPVGEQQTTDDFHLMQLHLSPHPRESQLPLGVGFISLRTRETPKESEIRRVRRYKIYGKKTKKNRRICG